MAVDYKALKNGGFMRQKQKDTFSLRLKVIGGNLTADQLVTIADTAKKFGNGQVHLTSRQGVEIPHVKLKDIDKIKVALAKGKVDTGVCGPRVRTVTACQGSEICPSGCVDTFGLAETISSRYFGKELPHKFKFGVTGCQNNCLKAEENDLGIKGGYLVKWNEENCSLCGVCVKACRLGAVTIVDSRVILEEEKCNNCGRCVKSCPTDAWEGKPGYLLSFGGTFGNLIAQGRQLLPIVIDSKKLFKTADKALDFFTKHGHPGERFRQTIERVGWDRLQKAIGVKNV